MQEDLEIQIKDMDKTLESEKEQQIEALKSERDTLFDERMAPLQAQIDNTDEKISAKWDEIDLLYKEQEELSDQLTLLEKEVSDLDKQAEFGLLSVINDAIQNADEKGISSPSNDDSPTNLSDRLNVGPLAE